MALDPGIKTPLPQLKEEDKEKPDFLVRLLTEPGDENDNMRREIYDALIANPQSANEFNIITYEQIMTAIAGNYDKEENILEEAVKLMILVFQDFGKNTAAKFNSIVERMTENADKFVQAAGGKLGTNQDSSNPFHAQASVVFNRLARSNPEEASKLYEPRPVEPAGVVVDTIASPETELSKPPTGILGPATISTRSGLGAAPDPDPLKTALPPGTALATSRGPGAVVMAPRSDPALTAPLVELDPRIKIYTQALEKIKENLEKINIYKGNYTVDLGKPGAPEEFNSKTFFDDLDRQEILINDKLAKLIAPAPEPVPAPATAPAPSFPDFTEDKISEINTEINKYIDKVEELNKIKEAVRQLDIDSNIYFFQFSFLQTKEDIAKLNNPIRDEAKQTIREIQTKRDEIITDLLTKQTKAKDFIDKLDSELPKSAKAGKQKVSEDKVITKIFNTRSSFIQNFVKKLNKKLRGIIEPPKLTDVDEAKKNRIFTELPTLPGSIERQSVESDLVREKKSEILTIIFKEMKSNSGKPGKTAVASTAVTAGNKLSINVKKSDEAIVKTAATMLKYADQVSLAEKLVIYVQKIIDNIKSKDFLAEKFMELLEEDREPGVLFKPSLPVVAAAVVVGPSTGASLASASPEPKSVIPEPPGSPEPPEPSADAAKIKQINDSFALINTMFEKFNDDYKFDTKNIEDIEKDLKEYTEAVNKLGAALTMINDGLDIPKELSEKTQPTAKKTDEINAILVNETLLKKNAYVDELAKFKTKISEYDTNKTDGIRQEAEASITLAQKQLKIFDIIYETLTSDAFIGVGVKTLQLLEPDKQDLLEEFKREMTSAGKEMAKKILEYEEMQKSFIGLPSARRLPAQQVASARGVGTGSPQGSSRTDTPPPPGSARVSPPGSARTDTPPVSARVVSTDDTPIIAKFSRAITDAQAAYKIMNDREEKLGKAITTGSTNDDKKLVKDAVDKLQAALDIYRTINDKNTKEVKGLKEQLDILDGAISKVYDINENWLVRAARSAAGRQTVGDTPRIDREAGQKVQDIIQAISGGTRRGGKRFHKKTIKNNLVHKKTFKKNIVNNKIVHKKTFKKNIVKNNIVKNNIVKNNIVKNNIVKNKTIHKNQLKRKQTHKNN